MSDIQPVNINALEKSFRQNPNNLKQLVAKMRLQKITWKEISDWVGLSIYKCRKALDAWLAETAVLQERRSKLLERNKAGGVS